MIGLFVAALACGLLARLRFKTGALGTCAWALVGTIIQQVAAWETFNLARPYLHGGNSLPVFSSLVLAASVLVGLLAVYVLLRLVANRFATRKPVAPPAAKRQQRRSR